MAEHISIVICPCCRVGRWCWWAPTQARTEARCLQRQSPPWRQLAPSWTLSGESAVAPPAERGAEIDHLGHGSAPLQPGPCQHGWFTVQYIDESTMTSPPHDPCQLAQKHLTAQVTHGSATVSICHKILRLPRCNQQCNITEGISSQVLGFVCALRRIDRWMT